MELLEFLASPRQQAALAGNNKEFAVDPDVPAPPEIARFGRFKPDPIDVAAAGTRLGDAARLMNRVGWD